MRFAASLTKMCTVSDVANAAFTGTANSYPRYIGYLLEDNIFASREDMFSPDSFARAVAAFKKIAEMKQTPPKTLAPRLMINYKCAWRKFKRLVHA